jgi:hypothetical protein
MRSVETDERTHLWFLKRGIDTWFEISEITEYTFLELFHVSDGSAKSLYTLESSACRWRGKKYLKSKHEGSDDICTSDMIETVPQYTTDIFLVWEQKAVHAWWRGWVVWMVGGRGGDGLVGGIQRLRGGLPSRGSSGKKELKPV